MHGAFLEQHPHSSRSNVLTRANLFRCSQVKFEEGQALAKKLHANFIETSAKDNKNISESRSTALP